MVGRRGYTICYICGEALSGPIDYDHVPPKLIYPENIRKKYKLNLLTLPVHKTCHEPFKKDEEYFFHSIAPVVEAHSGLEVWEDIIKRSKKPELINLYRKVYSEFDRNPSGLILPRYKVIKRFEGKRIWRIVWKITRGLFFKEYGIFLPQNTPYTFDFYSPNEDPNDVFQYVANEPSKGLYPRVFDYKYMKIPELNNFHSWAILFWDTLIMQISFHDPTCSCEVCQGSM